MPTRNLRLPCSSRVITLRFVLVQPGLRIVLLFLFVPTGENAAEIFGVLEILPKNERSIGVVNYVLPKVQLIREHVIDHRAEKNDVAIRTQRKPYARHGGGTRK